MLDPHCSVCSWADGHSAKGAKAWPFTVSLSCFIPSFPKKVPGFHSAGPRRRYRHGGVEIVLCQAPSKPGFPVGSDVILKASV